MDLRKCEVKSLRQLRGKTFLKEIAARCGFSISRLSRFENGKDVPPDEALPRLARGYGVSISIIKEAIFESWK